MRRILFLLALLPALVAMASGGTESMKTAVVVAHYGSSDPVTRSKTINQITAEVREALPGYDVREAYISPAVRRRMTADGVESLSPAEVLAKLASDGYERVYVLPTTIIDGGEMASVRSDADSQRQLFKELVVCPPLLYSPADFEALAGVLAKREACADEDVIYVGHGNMLPSTATYAMLDHVLKAGGHPQLHVSTIEGYPTAASTVALLKPSGRRKVVLVPLLLVCGKHTKEEIAVEYRSEMEKAGFDVEVVMQGLGENPEVRQLYVKRLLEAMKH